MPRKLKRLLAVHLALSVAPAAMFLHPVDVRWIQLTGALAGVAFGQVMLLAFWAAMSGSSFRRRLVGSLVGVLYLAIWPAVAVVVSSHVEGSAPVAFAVYSGIYGVMFVVFVGVYLVLRRRVAELRHVEDPGALPAVRFQFSILNLLLITSVVAIVVGLMRARTQDVLTDWSMSLVIVLSLVAFIVNLVAAPWAALAPGPVRWRAALVALVAVMLGMAMAFTALSGLPTAGWRVWLFATQSLAFAIPPMVVVVSLLVVRSCGYRLLRKSVAAEMDAAGSVA